jgi:hypothetical protein
LYEKLIEVAIGRARADDDQQAKREAERPASLLRIIIVTMALLDCQRVEKENAFLFLLLDSSCIVKVGP